MTLDGLLQSLGSYTTGQVQAVLFNLVVLALVIVSDRAFRSDNDRKRLAHTVFDALYTVFDRMFLLIFLQGMLILGISEASRALAPGLRLGLLDGVSPLAVGLVYVVVEDFVRTILHYALHRVRWGWYFHEVHHSQDVMNPMSAWRIHFMELPPRYLILAVFALLLGGDPVSFVWYTAFNAVYGYLLHSDFSFHIGPLDRVFVTPQYHRIHHSLDPRHIDTNFSERLVLWDYMLGTARFDYDNVKAYGIDGGLAPEADELSVGGVLRDWVRMNLHPFVSIYRDIVGARAA